MDAFGVLCAQLMRDLFAIAKFLVLRFQVDLQRSKIKITCRFKFDRRVDGAKQNQLDSTLDAHIDRSLLIGVDSQV